MTQDKALEVLDELLALEAGLSGWELDFVESLNSQRENSPAWLFSEKQIDVLEKLEARLLK